MDEIIEIIKQMEVGHLLVMAAMFWWFNGRMEKKFDKIDARFERMELKFDKIDTRFEKIEDRLNSIDKRLFVVEAILHMKGCCAITEDKNLQKAE